MRESRDITKPLPGFWMIKLVKNGPEVPACIRLVHTTADPDCLSNLMDRSPFLAAWIGNRTASLDEVWQRKGRAITAEEYDLRIRELSGDPTQPIDRLTVQLPF